MLRFAGLLSLVAFAAYLYCVLDVVLTEESRIRNLPKLLWVVLVVLVPLVGCVAWVVGGRPIGRHVRPGGTVRPDHPAGRSRQAPPKGPDDDPRFLRSLEDRLRREAEASAADDPAPAQDPDEDAPVDDDA